MSRIFMLLFAFSFQVLATENEEHFEKMDRRRAERFMKSIPEWNHTENCPGGIWGRTRKPFSHSVSGKFTTCRREHKKLACVSTWKTSKRGYSVGAELKSLYMKLTSNDCVLR